MVRDPLTWLGLGCVLVGLTLEGRAGPAPDRPNAVFIFADDLGYGDLSCYGSRQVETPKLDQIAREGACFTRFHVGSPICSPSRTAVMTGMFPARWRITSYLQTRAGHRYCKQADWLDPRETETTNLASREPEITARLTDLALTWRKSLP
jgi:hypothetical protein